MFKDAILSTDFSTNMADQCFAGKVGGDSYYGDVSFKSTLRALLANRIGENDRAEVLFRFSAQKKSEIERSDESNLMFRIFDPSEFDNGSIVVLSIDGSEDDRTAIMALIKRNFLTCFGNDGWTEAENVERFFIKSLKCLCYMQVKMHKVVVILPGISVAKMHYLQCAIFALLPWYFNPSEGVDEDEMALIRSLMEKTPDKYREMIKKLANQFDFRKEFIKKQLDQFETKAELEEKKKIEEAIKVYEDGLKNLYEKIHAYNRSIYNWQASLLGIETRIANNEGNHDLSNFFIGNKNVELVSANGDKLRFITKGTFSYFNQDLAEKVINNKRSYLYELDTPDFDCDDVENLMRAIFIDQMISVRVCAMYEIELGAGVSPICDGDFSEFHDDNTYFHNPHINKYSCMGDFGIQMEEAVKSGNYIAAIETCIASCRNLNFGDSTVMRSFVYELFCERINRDRKFLVIHEDSGKADWLANTYEALSWLAETGYYYPCNYDEE